MAAALPGRDGRGLSRRALLCGLAAAPATLAADEAIWPHLIRGEAVLFLRHAFAPGTGDPPGFRLDDPSTQRNLDAGGREQAARIGAAMRARGVRASRVLSSQWRRCVETAELIGLGPVEFAPAALNSFFGRPERAAEARAAMLRLLAEAPRGAGLLLAVTHQVNVTALAGFVPRPGEGAAFALDRQGGHRFLGRITIA